MDEWDEISRNEHRAGELEALLFASPRPVSTKLIAKRLELPEEEILALLRRFAAALRVPSRGLQLREIHGSWRLETKPEHAEIVRSVRAERGERPLSQRALESLAVVALRQPVTTEEVTAIRGLDSTGTLETLLKRRMIAKIEDRETGKGVHWRTTQNFLDLFGLGTLADLYRDSKLERIFGSVYGAPETHEHSAEQEDASK